jgi:hypothetical protein
MVTATFFFLGLAICIFAGLICFSMARSMQKARYAAQTNQPAIDEKAVWLQLKAALVDLYSRYEARESPRQKALRSWAGTLVICAGLCMIGILLEVEYNQFISIDQLLSSFTGR